MKKIQLDDDHVLVIFQGYEDLNEVHQLQDILKGSSLIFVALEGTNDKYLRPDRFLVENYETSMRSHFLYNGLLTEGDRERYLIDKSLEFIESGEQMFIETYEFTADEPFYDYIK